MQFAPYPFERLSALLQDITPPRMIDLSIGEPQFPTPLCVQQALQAHTDTLRFYPKSGGEDFLKEAQRRFIEHRFKVRLSADQILPTLGSKEALFNFPIFYLHDKPQPKIAMPDPLYQVYLGSAQVAKAQPLFMPLSVANHFTPELDPKLKPHLVILNSPNNPTGRALNLEALKEWVLRALEENFVLINDECYSNIYATTPPPSILQACTEVGNTEFKNVLAINSLSKTLSVPGVRSAYVAGDANILREYKIFRGYSGCAIPLPLQYASAVGWLDFGQQEQIRQLYATNLTLAQEILGVPIAPTSFYVWLEAHRGEDFARYLFAHTGIKVLPGGFLSPSHSPHSAPFVRVALVYESMRPILEDLKRAHQDYLKSVAC
ncbi:aminotransferase class I/II-fold pyridoxal phosphate-dependent enzyme [Helicobacter baculiformis]|uniref:Aminotransferase class I/II-fold pyridoxal phosphate-dependent enzyme n=1 Tax=Helicobacter baculiformis TaxID=427351 RepID=A0ABV7ZJT8_9HELI|nr:aminotransferase class I/II-fold pyridoxal phosphate-dependent enzyme [Helicobacter baculiformis]